MRWEGRGVGGRWVAAPNRIVPTGTSLKETEDNANRTEPNRNTHGHVTSIPADVQGQAIC